MYQQCRGRKSSPALLTRCWKRPCGINLQTQKVESVNRRLKRSLPSSVNFTRNYSGRAVYSVNHGPGHAIKELCSGVASPIPSGISVSKNLDKEHKRYLYEKARSQSVQCKLQMRNKRHKLYKLHDCKIDEEIYAIKDRVMIEKKIK